MDLSKAVRLVALCYDHPEVHKLYLLGDNRSRNQTKHDIEHGIYVRQAAIEVTRLVSHRFPDVFDDWTTQVVIPLAAFLHDIGRAIDVEKHHTEGARWADSFLRTLTLPGDSETLPDDVIKRVVRIIACHRSSVYLKSNVDDPALDVVLIADKCVGDEDRVRWCRQQILRVLTWFRLAWIPLRRNGAHDQANFAIKKANISADGSDLLLQLTLDQRVCKPSLIYQLYGERFQCCVVAAKKLGFDFKLEFNGTRYVSGNNAGQWSVELR